MDTSVAAPTSKMRSRIATLPEDVRIHYLDFGDTDPAKEKRPLLVFLAGMGYTAYIFESLIEQFLTNKKNPLASKYRIISMTRRGSGKSDRPCWGYDMDTRAKDIYDLLDAIGFSQNLPVSLVGHSIAGGEMTRFAVQYPKRTSRLVYLDAIYNYTDIGYQSTAAIENYIDSLQYYIALKQALTKYPDVEGPGYLSAPFPNPATVLTIEDLAKYYHSTVPNSKNVGNTIVDVFGDIVFNEYDHSLVYDPSGSYFLWNSSSEADLNLWSHAQEYMLEWDKINAPVLLLVPDYDTFNTDYPWLVGKGPQSSDEDEHDTPLLCAPRTLFRENPLRPLHSQLPPPLGKGGATDDATRTAAISLAKQNLISSGAFAESQANIFQQVNPKCQQQTIAQTSHFLFVDKPHEVLGAMIKFL